MKDGKKDGKESSLKKFFFLQIQLENKLGYFRRKRNILSYSLVRNISILAIISI